MLTVVLCLTDIIKYNETLTHPNNRGQTNRKMVLYKHKPHLLGTCLILICDIQTSDENGKEGIHLPSDYRTNYKQKIPFGIK